MKAVFAFLGWGCANGLSKADDPHAGAADGVAHLLGPVESTMFRANCWENTLMCLSSPCKTSLPPIGIPGVLHFGAVTEGRQR